MSRTPRRSRRPNRSRLLATLGTALGAALLVPVGATAPAPAEAAAYQEAQVAALRNATQLSLARYDTGLTNYIEVLDAEELLYPAESALAQTRRDQLVAVVNLYKALGGGWQLQEEQVATR